MTFQRFIMILFAMVFCSGCQARGQVVDAPVGAVSPHALKLHPPTGDRIYFAAFPDFGGPEDVVSSQRIRNFEIIANKKLAWACFSQNWYNGIVYPRAHVHAIYDTNTIPYVRLMPRSNDVQGVAETYFTMQNIIDGVFDVDLRNWARDAVQDNIPLMIDFAVEANGDWFGYSGIFNGAGQNDGYGDPNYPDGPERYRDAYRHIIDLFRQEGADNVTWFYHFNYSSFPDVEWNQPKYYYPGDDYIDWIGFSLYGAQTITEEWAGLEFSAQLSNYINAYREINSSKPVALLEFGVTDFHPDGDKSAWLIDAFQTILNNPYIKFSAISPWHENWQNEDGTTTAIRLDSSVAVKNTFRSLINNDRFISSVEYYPLFQTGFE